MERIMIIGCCGAGKTTLARALGQKTGLPVVYLDQIWWAPGNWQHVSREAFDAALMKALEKEHWIIDGNFDRTMELRLERCDSVIFLDMSRFVCLKNWIFRVVKNRGTARADMAPGCTEWFDPEMARMIWQFNGKNRRKYHEMLGKCQGKQVYILKNSRQVKAFLQKIAAPV